MTLAQWLIVLNWLIAFGIPIAVALITHAETSSTAKALTNLAFTGLSTAILTIVLDLSSRHAIDWFSILFSLVTSFVVSGASYAHIWQPTGVTPALASQGRHVQGVK